MKTMHTLITGASGMIGTALIERLRQSGKALVCQSRTARPSYEGVHWIQHNLLTDSWECLDPYTIDEVYLLAGQTSTYRAAENPSADLAANVLSLLHLIEYFKRRCIRPFLVLAGTATQVGPTATLPITEAAEDSPITLYDLSKLTAERYLLHFVREGVVDGCSLRLSNVFGRHNCGQQRDRGVLDKVFLRASLGEPITVYGDGSPLRDYIFIDDVISAFTLAPRHRENTSGRFFYIGSGRSIALKEAFHRVASLGARKRGSPPLIEHVPPPKELSPIEFRNGVFDCSGFAKATGWHPRLFFEEAIELAYSGGGESENVSVEASVNETPAKTF